MENKELIFLKERNAALEKELETEAALERVRSRSSIAILFPVKVISPPPNTYHTTAVFLLQNLFLVPNARLRK